LGKWDGREGREVVKVEHTCWGLWGCDDAVYEGQRGAEEEWMELHDDAMWKLIWIDLVIGVWMYEY
jgi:hypothetical protein